MKRSRWKDNLNGLDHLANQANALPALGMNIVHQGFDPALN
jgi:hypothetical protein